MTLISVITPTWQRHRLLIDRCLPSVKNQTWPLIEHIVVSDGPDRELASLLTDELWKRPLKSRRLVYLQLTDHPDGDVDYGSRARNHGLKHATGDIVAYLDDDNAWRPNHLEVLAPALESSDFAYTRMLRHPHEDEIGAAPPAYGSVDTSLIAHRAGLPQRCGMWPLPAEITGDKHAPDWGVVERWLRADATWTHVPEVTVDYYFP